MHQTFAIDIQLDKYSLKANSRNKPMIKMKSFMNEREKTFWVVDKRKALLCFKYNADEVIPFRTKQIVSSVSQTSPNFFLYQFRHLFLWPDKLSQTALQVMKWSNINEHAMSCIAILTSHESHCNNYNSWVALRHWQVMNHFQRVDSRRRGKSFNFLRIVNGKEPKESLIALRCSIVVNIRCLSRCRTWRD